MRYVNWVGSTTNKAILLIKNWLSHTFNEPWMLVRSDSTTKTLFRYLKGTTRKLDPNDGQTRYLLGRCYMAQQKYEKAYEAYQAAV
jgi:tetratricopeptide (TPR) repeat protein